MAEPARGVLQEDAVIVPETAEANRIHNKGQAGTPMPGNALRLELVEAAHLVETGRLKLEGPDGPMALEGLLRAAPAGAALEVQALAYRDLRGRGLTVRPAEEGLLVWARGATVRSPPWFRQRPVSERDPVRAGELVLWASEEAVLSVVDEEGEVTHYRLAPETPEGGNREPALPEADGVVLEDRVLVADAEAARAYHAAHVGTPYGQRLILSFTEAERLRRRGTLRLPDDLPARARLRQHHFDRTWPVYDALRDAGVLPRSGFRFGTHLRGYRGDPDAGHAEWLFQCHFPDDALQWSEISRAVRLAHGVRKTFCLAVVGPDVRYVRISWFRP